jgi:RNA polymerase sigma-70 factor (ECF subfamily)
MHAKDHQIIELLQQQDKKAIDALYDQYSPALYGIVLKIVRSEMVAQDVLQEAFVKIWSKGSSYDPSKGTLFTWMLNITRNTAIDKQRMEETRSKNSEKHTPEGFMNPQIDHIGLNTEVGKLEEKYRKVIDLIYFEGYTQEEVTEALNIPLGTVKSRVRIALRELRKVFSVQYITMCWLLLLIK